MGNLGGKPQNISLYHSVIGKINNVILMHKTSVALSKGEEGITCFFSSYSKAVLILIETLFPVQEGCTSLLGGGGGGGQGRSTVVKKKA